ncbi:MAG TPA: cytochrome C [Gammaproteobacteria bacterium]|mgnify:CR=1 FL=1|nr:cytochrome C [Gammaproteobacteria bacterium]
MFRTASGILVLIVVQFFAMGDAVGGNTAPVNYILHCQGCHRPGGGGYPGIVPNMRNQVGLFLRSRDGRAFLVQVPGVSQSSLSDAELAALMNWMLPEFDPLHVTSDFKRFTADEVREYRSTPIIELRARRRKLLSLER